MLSHEQIERVSIAMPKIANDFVWFPARLPLQKKHIFLNCRHLPCFFAPKKTVCLEEKKSERLVPESAKTAQNSIFGELSKVRMLFQSPK